MDDVYVISWRYHDGSASGVIRAYADRQRAEEDLDLLSNDCSGKEYTIDELPVYYDGRKPVA